MRVAVLLCGFDVIMRWKGGCEKKEGKDEGEQPDDFGGLVEDVWGWTPPFPCPLFTFCYDNRNLYLSVLTASTVV
jgi:hypothetical protein